LCGGCKKYLFIRPLSKEEISQRYYSGKPREVLIVSSTGWHFKTL
jgi:hypothetical protein